ncbi:MAG: aminotransferase class I/II-fold pyridoxal phosphate-dependent enzyme [Candidatus Electryonea clarkiae]|nr:aminotransferase class I/II-fold pyridoxal phosphate-dependent enzyme [Candidatus Electryonea clarkiae]MDP8286612.1 aminotransferase class I/II-fold pyridoxal phosphate-dependent enzyme [Candidatus Electryonea clarkiae]
MSKHNPVQPALRTENIRYAVRDIVVLANEVASTGKQMLYLNIGDPNQYDFQTPDHIIESTYQAMRDNYNGYSPSSGIKPAVEAIEREAERKGIENIRDIFVTTGASEAIEICLTALVNDGENVLTPSPGYPLYTAVLAKLGVIENPYYLDESNGWQPDLADIRNKVNDKTRAIVLINPNNPTGSNCSEELIRGLIEIARENDIVIFSDEIYDKLLFDNVGHTSTASLDKDAPIITFNGLSKNYLGPGLRIGWGIVSGDLSLMEDYIEAINKILRARLCANHPLQYSIQPALEGDQSHLGEMVEKLTRRRDLTVEMMNDIDGISCVKPNGAFYAFPKIDVDIEDDEWVKGLIKETGVVVVPGSGFGQVPGTKHFRIVYLPPEDILEKAYKAIGKYMKRF